MIKHDYGHMGCPYYEETLDNEVKVIIVPSTNPLKSALVYVSQGGYVHPEESLKVPFGAAYYLMNMILSQQFKENLKKEGVLAQSQLDYSFVTYQLNTLGDIYSPLKKLLNRIAKPSYAEKDVERFRNEESKTSRQREQDPVYLAQKHCLENLYLSSPLRNGYLPSQEQGVRLHASTLAKYQTSYYTGNRIVLLVSTDEDPKVCLDKIKEMRVKLPLNTSVDKFEFKESYTAVKEEFTRIKGEANHSYLTYGLKMPLRQNIYEKYGQLVFAAYEILLPSLFTENEKFLEQLRSIRAHLVKASLAQGGEDMAILLTIQGEDEFALTKVLGNYFAHLDQQITSSEMKGIIHAYYANSMRVMANPAKLLPAIAMAYANHMPYTELVNHVYHINYNTYRSFLDEFSHFKKAVCFVQKGSH